MDEDLGYNTNYEPTFDNDAFEDDINQHADKISGDNLTEEDASHISEVSTNEKSKQNQKSKIIRFEYNLFR